MLALTDGNSHTTNNTYDELDRLSTITNAENETLEYKYDPVGNTTHQIEADNVTTLYNYDNVYRLDEVILNYKANNIQDADTNVNTRYGYDPNGNLTSIIDANSHVTSFEYNRLDRLIKEIDAEGDIWAYQYDPVGNRTVRTDANGNITNYSYYRDNQPKSITYYDETSATFTYDQNNNRIQMDDLQMDDHIGTTKWTFDTLNRITNVTDALDRDLAYSYDPVGNRIGITYPDMRKVTYDYYKNNWLKSMNDPEGGAVSYERDGVGNTIKIVNPNTTQTDITYDKVNRVLSILSKQTSGGKKTNSAFNYIYDDVSQRVKVEAEYGWRNPSKVVTDYTYDNVRRLVRAEDSEGIWTEYSYDRIGNRIGLGSNDDSRSPEPFDELTQLYSYNDVNQLLTLVEDAQPGKSNVKRNENVAQALYAFRHEVRAQSTKHITEAAANVLLEEVSLIITDLESVDPDEEIVNQMIEALEQKVNEYRISEDIDSDGVQNSLLVKLAKASEANAKLSGKLKTTTYLYDANGSRVNKELPGPQGPKIQGTDYTFDPEDRLVSALDYQGNEKGNRIERALTTMDYDGLGRRLAKTYDPKGSSQGGAKKVEYVFDSFDPVVEYNIWNPQYQNYYRGDENKIAMTQHLPAESSGQRDWYHYDASGSVVGLTKHNGQSTHNYRYEPFGQIEMPPGNFTDPHNHYTFTGQEWDENLGLYEFYARTYDPYIGAWTGQDDYRGYVQEPRSLHRYMYVYDNPINYRDWYGFSLWEDIKNTGKEIGKGILVTGVDLLYNLTILGTYIDESIVYTPPILGVAVIESMLGGGKVNKTLDSWHQSWSDTREGLKLLKYEVEESIGVAEWKHSARYTDRNLACDVFTGVCHIRDLKEASLSERSYILTNTVIEACSVYNIAKSGIKLLKSKGAVNVIDDVSKLSDDLSDEISKTVDDVGKVGEDLHRPYIRKGVTETVKSSAPKTKSGKFIDPGTRMPIEGDYHLGHKYGQEYWRWKKWAESQGLTQSEFNELMNNPDLYRIEDPWANLSHLFEDKAPYTGKPD